VVSLSGSPPDSGRTDCHTADVEIRRSPELEAVIRRLWASFARGDVAAMENLFVSDPALRFILSGDEDWLEGADVVPILRERSRAIGTVSMEFDRLEAFEVGDFGWTACTLSTLDEDGVSRSFRQTGVFTIHDGIWKAVQIHTSVGVPAQEVFGVELAESLGALVASLTPGNADEVRHLAGSRGVVTVMFTDIEGSTQLSAARGDRQWAEDIRTHFEAIRSLVEANDGRIVKTLGDGSMAVFGSASGAVDAAIAIHGLDDGLRVRIGIHSGEAVAVGDDYAGVAIAKAARITSAAAGGQTLVSSATREIIDRLGYAIGEPLTVELKGISGAQRLYPVSPAP
jgi:adenylate cyclase